MPEAKTSIAKTKSTSKAKKGNTAETNSSKKTGMFLATCVIECMYYAATKYHYLDATPAGYRINEERFKNTYEHLNELYEEI